MGFTPSGNRELAIEINADDNGASGAFDGVAGSASDMKMAVAGAGAVLAGAGVAALGMAAKRAGEFEDALTDLQKVTSAETAGALKDDLMDLSTETRSTKEELADIATQAGKFGVEGEKNIASFTETVAKMNGAIDSLSADEIGNRFGKIAGAIDFPMEDIERLGDAVNKLADTAKTDGAEITDFMQRAGIQMNNLGLAEDEMLGLAAAMNEASSSSEKASSKMQAMIAAIRDPKKVSKLADALGMSTEEFRAMREDNPKELLKQISTTMTSGGEDARKLRSSLTSLQRRGFEGLSGTLDTFEQSQKTANDQLENGGSLAKENELQMSTWSGTMHTLTQKIDNAAIAMGDSLLPYMKIAVKDYILPLVDSFTTLNAKTDGMAGVAVAAGAALTGLGMVAATVGPAIVAALSPILLPVAAIAAAVAGLWWIWKNNFGNIRGFVQETIGIVNTTLDENAGTLDSLKQTIMGFYEQAKVAFNAFKGVMQFVFREFVVPLLEELRTIWANNFGDILSETDATMSYILTIVQTVGKLISKFWKKYGDEIMTITKSVFGVLKLVIGTTMRAIFTAIKVVLALIRGDWEAAFGYIQEFAEKTFDDIVSYIKGDWLNGVKAAFKLVVSAFKWPFEQIYDFLIGNSLIPDTFGEITDFIEQTFLGNLKTVLGLVESLFTGKFGDVKDSVLETIENMGGAILDKIRGTIGTFKRIFNDAVPDELGVPKLSIGGGSLSIPSVDVGGQTIGGGSLSIPSTTLGGQRLDLPQLADGGIVDSATMAMIGEAGSEAVVPLTRLESYLDTAFSAGYETAGSGGDSRDIVARLVVEGDGHLADIIRENAEIVVGEHDQQQQNRLSRL